VLGDGDNRKTENLRSMTNVNGGAVAIGHPTGASGGRILMTLIYELRRIGGGLGAAAICGGYGQSDAIILRVD
jgi:acetyl-CoA C-acetyltransferase